MQRKVLFTASTFSHIRNFHLPYLRYFQERGWTVHAACGGVPMPIPYADEAIALPFEKRMGAPENFKAAALLRTLIRREGYALISTHTSLAAFFTRLAVKGMKGRPPVVNTVHGYLFDDETPALKRGLLLAAERLTAPQTDLLLTMNRWDYALARKRRLGKRVALVPGMGVDFHRLGRADPAGGARLRAELGIPQDAFVLLYPAEFSKRKSQEVLIRAMARMPERAVLALPGEGALWGECKELAARLGLAGRVLFPGQVEDMGRWYAMADGAASASRSEGLPFNVMEAMYCGLPLAASRVKGHTDLIDHGVTGLLYPYGDADACAGALLALTRPGGLGQRLASNAQRGVEGYGLERVLPVLVALYESVLPEGVGAVNDVGEESKDD